MTDLKDSNVAAIGSELDKKQRLEAAKTELAWNGVGLKPELKVWRIEQFHVVPWPTERFGEFYSGDSYIVLNTWKQVDSPKLLGSYTSQDEAGTAAYKTVELDDILGQIPVQHREVQDHESSLFRSYFKDFQILDGGAESGFHHVSAAEYKPKLLQIRINKKGPFSRHDVGAGLVIKQVPLSFTSLNQGDVFIFDGGNGSQSSGAERVKCAEFAKRLQSSRKGLPKLTVFDEGDNDARPFFEAIGGEGGAIAHPVTEVTSTQQFEKVLLRLSDSSGKMIFSVESRGVLSKDMLDSSDVFILNAGYSIWVWVGKETTSGEKSGAMKVALHYIDENKISPEVPITRIIDGGENAEFLSLLC